MAMAMVSPASCSNLVMSNPSISSSAQSGDCFPQIDALWSDVDLAERYLISSQFHKAATLCSTVLQQLKYIWELSEHSTYGGIDEDEIKDIVEAAGMVLIQAYSESGRSRMIFNDLETIFGSLAKVPSSVFLAGLCLQISAKLYLDAQLSIESFLKPWAFTALNDKHSCEFKPKSDQRQIISLAPEKYIKIVELYCVQVLSKGLGRIDLALQWVTEADIPTEIKQVILKELDMSSSVNSKDKRDLVSGLQKVTSNNAQSVVDFNRLQVEDRVESEIETRLSKKAVKELDSHSSLKSVLLFSPLIDTISGWMDQSLKNKSNYSSVWHKILTTVYQRKASFGGAAAVFIMIAIYRQRFHLSRALGGLGKGVRHLLRALFMSLFDFWHLAFNVQLNPLAAVQPFPPAQQLR